MRPRPRQLYNSPSVKIAKNNQEGRINQCFYFDKALNKSLYIPFKIMSGTLPVWNGRLRHRRSGDGGWIGILEWNFFCVLWAWWWLLKGCRILQLRKKWNTGYKKLLQRLTVHCAGWDWCSWLSGCLWFLSAGLSTDCSNQFMHLKKPRISRFRVQRFSVQRSGFRVERRRCTNESTLWNSAVRLF